MSEPDLQLGRASMRLCCVSLHREWIACEHLMRLLLAVVVSVTWEEFKQRKIMQLRKAHTTRSRTDLLPSLVLLQAGWDALMSRRPEENIQLRTPMPAAIEHHEHTHSNWRRLSVCLSLCMQAILNLEDRVISRAAAHETYAASHKDLLL